MSEDREVLPFRRKAMIGFLAFAGACIDAASYLALGRVFTANMTGNTIVFVLAIAQGNREGMLRLGVALAGFVLGAAAGELIMLRFEYPGRLSTGGLEKAAFHQGVVVALLFEVLDLLAILFWWWLDGAQPAANELYPLIVLSAVAMGVQSTVVRRLHVGWISTTYITGTITGLSASLADWLHGLVHVYQAKEEGRQAGQVPRGPIFPAAVWLIYAVGAVTGGMASVLLHFFVMLLPVAAILFVVLLLAMERREAG